MEALLRAVQRGQVDALRQLLSADADVAASDCEGWTVLHWASEGGQEECIRVLLEAAETQGRLDAVLNAVDKYGKTPLDMSINGRCFSLLLQRGGRGRLALHRAAEFGLVDVLRQLLGSGADVVASDSYGRTALHWACYAGEEECVHVLLETAETQGRLVALLNAVTVDGDTPLDMCSNDSCSSLLVDRGGRGRV